MKGTDAGRNAGSGDDAGPANRAPVGRDGQYATTPMDFPFRGWWQVALRLKDRGSGDNLSVVAAGVAFYGFLAVFPMIGAVMTVFGLIAEPEVAARQMEPFQHFMPAQVYEILMQQVIDVTSAAETSLNLGLAFSLLLMLWSATKGIKAMLTALNVAYKQREKRGFVRLSAVAMSFAAGAVVFVIFSLALVAAIPVVLEFVGLGIALETTILLVRWPVVAALVMVALALLYRYGPNRRDARLEWITPGTVVATLLWLAVSMGFSYYVSSFGNYDETFGSLGAVVVLLFWFYLSAYAICIGAELNAELELQTERDSTVGPDRPMGQRGAYVADHTSHGSTHS